MERIVLLEEEVTTLCWKKACTCGEGKGNGIAVASTSGDQEEHSELEYAEEEEGSDSGVSYHVLLVAPEETLLVFGSPISQSLLSARNFYGLFKLLFLSFNPPYIQTLALMTL